MRIHETIVLTIPVTQVMTPVTQVMIPVTQVMTPVTQVMTPVTQVTTPVTQVTTPVTQVTTPVTQVTTPVTQVMTLVELSEFDAPHYTHHSMETSSLSVQHQGPLPSTLAILATVSGGTPTVNVFQQDGGQGADQYANVSVSVISMETSGTCMSNSFILALELNCLLLLYYTMQE